MNGSVEGEILLEISDLLMLLCKGEKESINNRLACLISSENSSASHALCKSPNSSRN